MLSPTPTGEQAPTPGPWHLQPQFRSIYALSEGDHGLTIFIAKAEGHQCGEAQANANARLIAAAPALLEALEAFNIKEGQIVGGDSTSLTVRVPLDVIRQADAAIRQARPTQPEGREP